MRWNEICDGMTCEIERVVRYSHYNSWSAFFGKKGLECMHIILIIWLDCHEIKSVMK